MRNQSAHGWKVNFCKFTNETRNGVEEATAESKQTYIAAVNGPCAGGGYELALAADYILMADDGNTSVSLPEVPLLAVRSEEHTSELQSLMRNSYAVFCLKKKSNEASTGKHRYTCHKHSTITPIWTSNNRAQVDESIIGAA